MIREIQPGEAGLVAEVMHELRPHRAVADLPALIDAQRADGYRLVASFDSEAAVAVLGFREGTNLAWGHHVYVDDLVTLPSARKGGHARGLLDWVASEAARLGCEQVHLDSGTHRNAAHRVYLANGYDITSFHFQRST
jgi:GNAT superfamily N-acetyltransferase